MAWADFGNTVGVLYSLRFCSLCVTSAIRNHVLECLLPITKNKTKAFEN